MGSSNHFDHNALNTIFHECRRCGTCCKSYRRIRLQPDEVDFIRKMGGHVGIELRLSELRGRSLDEAIAAARKGDGEIYMIHPDNRGCVFLEKRGEKYGCRIYHHRPRTCRAFRCNLADHSLLQLVGNDAITLLGLDRLGRPQETMKQAVGHGGKP